MSRFEATLLRPRAPFALAAVGGAACAALALVPGEAGPLAARAAIATLAVGALAAMLARRRGAVPPPPLRVLGRAALGRTAAVALVEADGRRFLLGAGERAVELLAELPPASREGSP